MKISAKRAAAAIFGAVIFVAFSWAGYGAGHAAGGLPLGSSLPHAALIPVQNSMPDLTGVWHADDGGTYYIRQIRDEVYWLGEQAPVNATWTNIAFGKLEGDGAVHLRWVDVPKGGTSSGGHLVLQVVSPGRLEAVSKSGGFGGSNWTR